MRISWKWLSEILELSSTDSEGEGNLGLFERRRLEKPNSPVGCPGQEPWTASGGVGPLQINGQGRSPGLPSYTPAFRPGVNATAIAELLTRRGLEVESIDRLDSGFEKVVTAQILERNPHPQADRLSLCSVSVGSGEPLQIVCGAQNMKAGDKVALAQVGALLPNGLKIAESKIRGVASHGMLCSEQELGLKESSEGILILPPSTLLGVPLAHVLGRDDTLFHLKLTANRGDCLSHFGIARELASAWGRKVKKPEGVALDYGKAPIAVQLEAGELAPQFYGCLIEDVKVGPSPEWVVNRLTALGSRSINNVVDATNLVMLELGHPTHAYDAKEIRGNLIQVRKARSGETLPLLDGETITLQGTELVIADRERAVGLAGVMGGGNSEVQDSSTSIFLECAEFDPVSVRRASTFYQRKTEAAHRFERGVDPAGLPDVMARLVRLVLTLAGGKIAGAVRQHLPSRGASTAPGKREIRFGCHYLNDFLGFERDQPPVTPANVENLLRNLECEVTPPQSPSDEWRVVPPSYRLDLRLKEDIAEEVARSIGYDSIPATIPVLTSAPKFEASSRSALSVMDRAKQGLVQVGLNETVNLAFTSQSWLDRFGLSSTVKVLNPLSEDHERLVPSLLPGLIRNTLTNWSHHFGSEPLAVRLFELRPVFKAKEEIKASDRFSTGVEESWKLAWVMTGPRYAESLRNERGEVDFYDLKAVFDTLVVSLGARGVRLSPMLASRSGGNPLFHPGQSAEILAGNRVAGHMGLLHPRLAKDLKTRAPLWMAELDWTELSQLSRKGEDHATFRPWPEFPPMERDFALEVKEDVTAEKVCQLAIKAGKPIAKSAKVFDIYRGSQVTSGRKSLAVRVIFFDENRSLQEPEVETASTQILQSWKKDLGAELRS